LKIAKVFAGPNFSSSLSSLIGATWHGKPVALRNPGAAAGGFPAGTVFHTAAAFARIASVRPFITLANRLK
jgi:hypothetical protein